MANTVVVGSQWGDEGKGKIVDYLTERADIVIRSQGGNNAGHTVIIGDTEYILHLIPSGILWPGKICILGHGVVLDPISLMEEISTLEEKGIAVSPHNLRISGGTHLVMPYHRELDACNEALLGKEKIGTTKRGIGPTYADKIERTGLRVADLLDLDSFKNKLHARVERKNQLLQAANRAPLHAEEILTNYVEVGKKLLPYITNTVEFLHASMAADKNLLFEGAQGTFLDIDYGTYPYVTSSSTTAGGACTGSGVPPHSIDSVVGVAKAYTTRVGEGPFVTENRELTKYFHSMGREYGATTGRARRSGWLDAVLLRYAGMVNGINTLAITNLDGLDALDQLSICIGYKLGNRELSLPPMTATEMDHCEPIYENMEGWQEDTTAVKKFTDLPSNAQKYLEKISALTNLPITLIGVGPDRQQTIVK